MSQLTVTSVIQRRIFEQITNPEEYVNFAKRSLSRELAAGALERYHASIESTVIPSNLDVELRLSLWISTREALEEYVKQRIAQHLREEAQHQRAAHAPRSFAERGATG